MPLLSCACRQVPDATSWAEWLLAVAKKETGIALGITDTFSTTAKHKQAHMHILWWCPESVSRPLTLSPRLLPLCLSLAAQWSGRGWRRFNVVSVYLCVRVTRFLQKFYPPWGFHSSFPSLWGSCKKTSRLTAREETEERRKNERRQWDKKREREKEAATRRWQWA